MSKTVTPAQVRAVRGPSSQAHMAATLGLSTRTIESWESDASSGRGAPVQTIVLYQLLTRQIDVDSAIALLASGAAD